MFFFDLALWETAIKLRAQLDRADMQRSYSEALSLVLLHELLRSNGGLTAPPPVVRGGLAAWQQKRVADYIEEHLAENIAMSTLASVVQLSPFHFSRAFRHSFGLPPHRFHVSRRIDQAKSLLANDALSMTEIGQQLGFSVSSAFAATFRSILDARRATIAARWNNGAPSPAGHARRPGAEPARPRLARQRRCNPHSLLPFSSYHQRPLRSGSPAQSRACKARSRPTGSPFRAGY